ncbi:uncharacterized protein G2W53_022132 [Senna tora]|uniref:Uncharacterized protein n=1 Tax=Senna tora TaxID=362788 RepID=A0A834TKQ5_9FABA|nr:uncharacterized protein G2W53_022132 [Senna tora]
MAIASNEDDVRMPPKRKRSNRVNAGKVTQSFFKPIDSTFQQHVSSGQPVIDTPPPISDAIPLNSGAPPFSDAPPISDAIPPNSGAPPISPEGLIPANTQADRELNKDWMRRLTVAKYKEESRFSDGQNRRYVQGRVRDYQNRR